MNDIEVWKEILGWEGFYSASTHGRIRSEERIITRYKTGVKEKHKSVILKPWIAKKSGKGYFMVGLSRGNETIKIGVHRLILWAFVGKQEKGYETRHLDGNCKNNHISNLAYGTRSENRQDAVKHLTLMRPKKLTKEDVIDICKMGTEKISSKIVSEKYNINRNTVTEIWRGEIWNHATNGIRPESTYHRKHDKLTAEQKKILLSDMRTIEISKILKIDRHTVSRWRKKFLD